ncbi:MAG: methylmalonyl-CoA mutase [Candidatus Eisenbacteria bacterium]|nr:methylmalonyl-CoA mutase [Candidatus Eisenbacteria bacterium]
MSSAENRKRWEGTTLKETLDRFPERGTGFTTGSGLPVERVYVPDDAPGVIHGSDGGPHDTLGLPGEYPFTRGVQPTMYRGRLWTMRQYAGFGTAAETNARFRYLLEQGQTGLSVAFDLPTQMGYDADDEMAEGEVGRVGVSVCSVEDMKSLFDGIPLDKVSTSMTINATAPLVMAMYLIVAEETGVDSGRLRGTVQNDILKEYAARGTHVFPPRPSVGFSMDLCAYCAERVPSWNTMSISGYHIREAGATAVEELAFTLADGIAYVEAARERGLDLETFTSRLSFFFDAHNDLFEEVAKLRAARRMWARIVRERFGIDSPRAQTLRFHTQTAGCTLTAQQPELNVVRVTVQALAAVLGGTQSLHTNSRDEALALPTEKSARIALRTQQVLAEESGVASVVDPLGGSYYVEALTDTVENEAWGELSKIDEMGGAVAAIEKGHFQRAIARSAYRQQQEIEEKSRIVVGVNSYETDESEEMEVLRVDPAIRDEKTEALSRLRSERDGAAVERALGRLSDDAVEGRSTMESALECARQRATLGEMTEALERVFGRYRPSETSW